uniref:Uncharacterized protein n=1 Tax=Plectus sambesii TaxID=2011161 RepID=A0A914WRW1_9BILA
MDRRSRRLSSEPSFPVTSSTQRIYNAGLRRFEESGTFSSSDSIMSTTESSAFAEENENGPASISAPPHAINNNDSHDIDAPLDDSVVVIRGDGRRDSDPDETSDISCMRMMSYGVGHFYNDLCASMWFTYLLMFMEKVLKFQSYRAGMLMLIGQVTDAICTPLVGIASDKSTLPRFMRSMGRRKAWHLIGTICVTVSFPFIFNKCLVWNKAQSSEWWSEWVMFAWFVPFIMIFQFGWAAVQISHLALIPELSKVDSSRTTMNSLRYAFTVLANVAVFGLLALFLSSASTEVVEPADLPSFR